MDDEPIQRKVARAVLLADGWEVDEAEDGVQALAKLAENLYTLVFLDIQMPELDGLATARAIRSGDKASASTPIVALTSLRGPEIAAEIVAAGMDGQLRKPCPPDELVAAARVWRPNGESAVQARLADLFGAAEFGAMVDGFRAQLAEALRLIEAPETRARAHRIGGLAGTLGFSEVSDAWLALSEGDESALPLARTVARKALHEIDARVGWSGTS